MVLVGYWPLNEDSGSTAYDYSGNGYDGNVNGATMGASGILGGTSYDFVRSNGDNIGGFNVSEISQVEQVSVSVWVKFDTTADNTTHPVFIHGDAWSDYLGITSFNKNEISWHVENRNNTGSASTEGSIKTTISENTWHHIVGTYDGSGPISKIYVDGVEKNSTTNLPSLTPPSSSDQIGKIPWASSGNLIDGQIAEIRVYDNALSASEVQYLYSLGKKGTFVSNKRTL